MSDKLQEFVNKHKKELETEEPSKDLWKKIDARLTTGPVSSGSKWNSNLKYLGFGASIIAITVYFISQKLNDSSSIELVQNVKDSALNNSGVWVKANQNDGEENSNKAEAAKSYSGGRENENKDPFAKDPYESAVVNHNTENHDTLKTIAAEPENKIKHEEPAEVNPKKDEKTMPEPVTNKIKKVTAPEMPSEMNSYAAALYEGSSLCDVLRIYKFPGKVNMEGKDYNYTGHRVLKTISCSRLEDMGNIKAVWIKGKAAKKITIDITEGLKNIVLMKSDGRKIPPVAISHYYSGMGVISDYSGKHFDMTFKDKVEFILFFNGAEEGDKIVIDEVIEATIKN